LFEPLGVVSVRVAAGALVGNPKIQGPAALERPICP
jgi:hypothetical protein